MLETINTGKWPKSWWASRMILEGRGVEKWPEKFSQVESGCCQKLEVTAVIQNDRLILY